MTSKSINRRTKPDPRTVTRLRYASFTRLSHYTPATIDAFDRERMGIAPKE
jgi:hypothetical protein